MFSGKPPTKTVRQPRGRSLVDIFGAVVLGAKRLHVFNRKTSLLAFELLTATDPKTESSDVLQDIAFVVLFGRIKLDVKSDVISGVLVAMVVVMSGAEEQNGLSIH